MAFTFPLYRIIKLIEQKDTENIQKDAQIAQRIVVYLPCDLVRGLHCQVTEKGGKLMT